MFITQGFKPHNNFWKYLLGSACIILASFIGQVPLMIAAGVESAVSGRPFPSTEQEFMTFMDSNTTFFLILLSFVFAIAGMYFVVKYLHGQSFREVGTARAQIDPKRILFSFALWGAFTIISTLTMFYLSPEDFVLNFKPIPFAILAVIAIVMVPIQTSTEEYVFRGYLMQGFALLGKNRWFPLLMTSVIFGTMHILNPEVEKMGYIVMIYYIGTGLFLGIVTLMDDGIELALGFHAANNLVGALLVTSDWTAFQTHSILRDASEPSAGFDVLLPVLVIYPILLYIFSKKYNWSNWREKLTGVL